MLEIGFQISLPHVCSLPTPRHLLGWWCHWSPPKKYGAGNPFFFGVFPGRGPLWLEENKTKIRDDGSDSQLVKLLKFAWICERHNAWKKKSEMVVQNGDLPEYKDVQSKKNHLKQI